MPLAQYALRACSTTQRRGSGLRSFCPLYSRRDCHHDRRESGANYQLDRHASGMVVQSADGSRNQPGDLRDAEFYTAGLQRLGVSSG